MKRWRSGERYISSAKCRHAISGRRCSPCSSKQDTRGSPGKTRATSALRRIMSASFTTATFAPRLRSTIPPTRPRSVIWVRSTSRATSKTAPSTAKRSPVRLPWGCACLITSSVSISTRRKKPAIPTCATARWDSASWDSRTHSTSWASRSIPNSASTSRIARWRSSPTTRSSLHHCLPKSAAPTRASKDRNGIEVSSLSTR